MSRLDKNCRKPPDSLKIFLDVAKSIGFEDCKGLSKEIERLQKVCTLCVLHM